MERSGINQMNNQRYNFIQMPKFKNSSKLSNNNNFNYLSQSQTIPKKKNENPMICSISDKIKQMKEELKKNDIYSGNNEYNNDFKLRLERITSRGPKNLMKNKLKIFENRREKEKGQKKNALDELDDIINKFKNDRYGN